MLKERWKPLFNANDAEKQVAAQQEISRLTIEDERLKVSKAKAIRRKTEAENEKPVDMNQFADHSKEATSSSTRSNSKRS